MKKVPQFGQLWKMYLEIVHNIVVFEVLRRELPNGFINLFKAVVKVAEQNGSVLAIVLAIAVGIIRICLTARMTQPLEEGSKKEPKENPKEEPKSKPKPLQRHPKRQSKLVRSKE